VQPVSIAESDFHALINRRVHRLMGLVSLTSACPSTKHVLVRPLLGALHSQAMQLEELLDAYDARNNCRWCSFRSLVATIKLFSNVSYELLHIKHALPAYRLLTIEADFAEATREALGFTGEVLIRAASQMLRQADILNLVVPTDALRAEDFEEHLPPGRLPRNCGARRKEPVSEMVTQLTTAFLNLAADSKDLRAAGRATPDEYLEFLQDAVREESIRNLELRFHNLQSQYDTYVAGSQAERQDPDLLVLRGHISIVFHLLRTATMFAHYYERHSVKKPCQLAVLQEPLVDSDGLVQILMCYGIRHINLYITCAEHLCQEMLKRYSEITTVSLPIPQYRGFHVRPSTLISKLVLHYGCDVQMKLDDEVYDARMPLELFRANEKINAQKRRWLAMEIVNRKLITAQSLSAGENFESVVRGAVLSLAERGHVIMYEQPLQLPEQPVLASGTLVEQVVAEANRLLTLGKIDVDYETQVSFVGDKRVLADISLLAQTGYGEDKFGNNIPLPDKLRYLRR
jgi:hypothetical protein